LAGSVDTPVKGRTSRDEQDAQAPEAQAAYLEGACAHDASLRARVDALLETAAIPAVDASGE
jgi:hypothetical protein